MGIGERPWSDFVIYTNKGISVQRVAFKKEFWNKKLLPKLISFYDNCVGPQIVKPPSPPWITDAKFVKRYMSLSFIICVYLSL